MSSDDDESSVRALDLRMYRYAIRLTVFLSIGSLIMLLLNWRFNFLSAKALSIMGVGVVFWMVMAYAYWQDSRERQRDESAARAAGLLPAKEKAENSESLATSSAEPSAGTTGHSEQDKPADPSAS